MKRIPGRAWRPGAIEEAQDGGSPQQDAAAQAAYRIRASVSAAADPAGAPAHVRAPAPTVPSSAPQVRPVDVPAAGSSLSSSLGLDAQVHSGLSERIDLLFHRFMAGKVTGEDLVLPSGQVLAVRNTPITRELVRSAEQAGVLPHLIAHMTFPELNND